MELTYSLIHLTNLDLIQNMETKVLLDTSTTSQNFQILIYEIFP